MSADPNDKAAAVDLSESFDMYLEKMKGLCHASFKRMAVKASAGGRITELVYDGVLCDAKWTEKIIHIQTVFGIATVLGGRELTGRDYSEKSGQLARAISIALRLPFKSADQPQLPPPTSLKRPRPSPDDVHQQQQLQQQPIDRDNVGSYVAKLVGLASSAERHDAICSLRREALRRPELRPAIWEAIVAVLGEYMERCVHDDLRALHLMGEVFGAGSAALVLASPAFRDMLPLLAKCVDMYGEGVLESVLNLVVPLCSSLLALPAESLRQLPATAWRLAEALAHKAGASAGALKAFNSLALCAEKIEIRMPLPVAAFQAVGATARDVINKCVSSGTCTPPYVDALVSLEFLLGYPSEDRGTFANLLDQTTLSVLQRLGSLGISILGRMKSRAWEYYCEAEGDARDVWLLVMAKWPRCGQAPCPDLVDGAIKRLPCQGSLRILVQAVQATDDGGRAKARVRAALVASENALSALLRAARDGPSVDRTTKDALDVVSAIDDDVPGALLAAADCPKCPISMAPWINPVVASDSHTYECAHITSWLLDHDTSPLTRKKMDSEALFTCRCAQQICDAWRKNAWAQIKED